MSKKGKITAIKIILQFLPFIFLHACVVPTEVVTADPNHVRTAAEPIVVYPAAPVIQESILIEGRPYYRHNYRGRYYYHHGR